MVLGIDMTNVSAFLILVVTFASPVASASDWPQTDVLVSGARTFTLENRHGQCFVRERPSDKAIDMNISAPCKFLHRGNSKEIIVEKYRKIGEVAAIAGQPIQKHQLHPRLLARYPSIKEGSPCSTEMRGLIIPPKGDIYPSYECYKFTKDAYCYNMGMDEKNYSSLAYSKDPQLQCALQGDSANPLTEQNIDNAPGKRCERGFDHRHEYREDVSAEK